MELHHLAASRARIIDQPPMRIPVTVDSVLTHTLRVRGHWTSTVMGYGRVWVLREVTLGSVESKRDGLWRGLLLRTLT